MVLFRDDLPKLRTKTLKRPIDLVMNNVGVIAMGGVEEIPLEARILAVAESFDAMTQDALAQNSGVQTLPTDEINYMRNAVKATVDAYDGTVTLYAWDESDPILQAWRSAFPGTVKDRSEIPADLLAHLRYPEDLFKVQRNMLATYHVSDPAAFYSGQDYWTVPPDPTESNGVAQPPYYLTLKMPGQDSAKSPEWNCMAHSAPAPAAASSASRLMG